jgi:hypothetical protein
MQMSAMRAGFGAGDPTGIMSRLYGFADMGLGNYGQSLDYYNQQLQGRQYDNPYGSPEYNSMVADNYWTDVDQQRADQLADNLGVALERSDFGDRTGAAASGFGGGSKYQIARGLAAGEADRNYKNSLADLQGQSWANADRIARGWADQNVRDQYADFASRDRAAGALYQAGRGGMDDLTRAYDFGQAGYGNQAGWGDYQYGFDRDRMLGGQQQWDAGWDPLRNFWNIIGGSSWGSQTQGSEESTSFDARAGFKEPPK